ncbi:MAG: GNAT family N-acetyltransferase [Micromonosporaceae bacterium]
MHLTGLTFRPATAADAKAIYELVAASEADLDGVIEIDLDDIVTELARPGFDLERDTRLGHDATSGELVGWAQVFRGDRAEVTVHPRHQGRGIGTTLLDWTEARAAESGTDHVGQTVTDNNAAGQAILRARGYAPKDTAWLLDIQLDAEPEVPALPEGYQLRTFQPRRDDHAVYQLIEDAFNEWPGRKPNTFEEWVAFTIGREPFAPALSPLIVAGDEIVGVAIVLDYEDASEGYVHQLAVQRSHRHRGLARVLLRHVFRDAYRSGRRSCVLATNSYTGALTLYQRVGMGIRRAYTHFERMLPPA